MRTVTDISGKNWNVYKVVKGNQITPNHVQVNIGIDAPSKGITLPASIADRWLNGEIRVKV